MPRRAKALLLLCLAAALLLTRPPQARATTIDPLIWEQLVADAAFVGVVECETAGGIVAGYRVVESWKGEPAGARFRVRMAADFWGPQFPVTLVGQRFVMAAFKSYAPTRMMSTTSGGPVPLWWRDIPAEYNLPLWQGRAALPLARAERPLGEMGSGHADLDAFKKDAVELISLSPEAREARVLRALSNKYLFPDREAEPEAGAKKLTAAQRAAVDRMKSAREKIRSSSSAREIVSELLEVMRLHPDEDSPPYSVMAVLSQGGAAVALGLLKAGPPGGVRLSKEQWRELVSEIEERAGAAQPPRAEERDAPQPPAAQRLAALRKALAAGGEHKDFDEAFRVLTEHDPAPVADYLVRWRNPGGDWRSTDFGYVIGSYFAWRCGKDREANLLKLTAAQDPFVRVAGAVYLAFENPPLAASKLEELSRLPGDPGVWAALNLARRGHRPAVPRALEVFSTSGVRGHMSSVPHRNLQLRLLVLLSNSAAASGLPQPAPPAAPSYDAGEAAHRAYQEKFYRYYVDWWSEHGGRVQLTDPWLKILEQQKVD